MRATGTDLTASRAQHRSNAATRRGHVLLGVATVMSLIHHLDHVVRGNHTGWPVTGQATPFTYSLVVYPLIALGVWLERSGRVGARFWAVLAGAGVAFLMWVHVGPAAVEPPAAIIDEYAAPWVGVAAFGWLVGLMLVLAALALHHARTWRHGTR